MLMVLLACARTAALCRVKRVVLVLVLMMMMVLAGMCTQLVCPKPKPKSHVESSTWMRIIHKIYTVLCLCAMRSILQSPSTAAAAR